MHWELVNGPYIWVAFALDEKLQTYNMVEQVLWDMYEQIYKIKQEVLTETYAPGFVNHE
jgi:hypothetical protein